MCFHLGTILRRRVWPGKPFCTKSVPFGLHRIPVFCYVLFNPRILLVLRFRLILLIPFHVSGFINSFLRYR